MPTAPHKAVVAKPRIAWISASPLRVMVSVMACQSRPRQATRTVTGSIQERNCAAGEAALVQVAIQAVPACPPSGHTSVDGTSSQPASTLIIALMPACSWVLSPASMLDSTSCAAFCIRAPGAPTSGSMIAAQVAGSNGLHIRHHLPGASGG